MPAYREEPGVAPDSATETFVALKMFIDNWRWAGVPFYIRTGKRLPRKVSEVSIHFKRAPHALFGRSGPPGANMLALRIQPDEGISLLFEAKVPGVKVRLRPVKMNFDYGGSFGGPLPDAYERLLLDAVSGDKTLFIHEEEAYRSWEFLEGIMEGWRRAGPPPFPNYAAGTWGPREADELLAVKDNEQAEARRDLGKLLQQLPPRQRLPIVHVKLEGRSVEETARLTGLSSSAIKVGIHRGLKALAAKIRGGA